MSTQSVAIPGVAGPVTLQSSFWAGWKVFVNGERIKPRSFGRLRLPGTAEPVEARLRASLLTVYPTIKVGDIGYPTGPTPALWLRVVAVLPIVYIVGLGVVPFLIGGGGAVANLTILRSDMPIAAKVTAMVGVFVVAGAVFAAAVFAAALIDA